MQTFFVVILTGMTLYGLGIIVTTLKKRVRQFVEKQDSGKH